MSMQNKDSYNPDMERFESAAVDLNDWIAQNRSRLVGVGAVVLLLLWLASGVYIVQPGEEGVVQTFGRFSSVATSGLNYHVPWPIQSVTVVDVANIRRTELGFRSEGQSDRAQVLNEALMLTADENIVQVELLIQYRIADSRSFVFNVQDPQDVLRTSAEVGLRSTVGNMTIDAVITEERARVQDETRAFLSQLMEAYNTGIQVTDVRLQVADPPAEVRDAFQEVVRALADKERLINEAEAYQNDIVPRARGEKQRLIEEATAFRDQCVLRATGDADRFLNILSAYQIAPDVTRERMHIEALEQVLTEVELILLDGASVGGQVVPFLPLGDLNSNDSDTPATITNDAQSTTTEGGE
ncbi:MAG: FtsH protease activity modulator HflK [Caldilineaceae bacterium]